VTSQYLLKSLRTLRQACRATSLAYRDSPARDCHTSMLADVCVINEEIDTVNVAAGSEPPRSNPLLGR